MTVSRRSRTSMVSRSSSGNRWSASSAGLSPKPSATVPEPDPRCRQRPALPRPRRRCHSRRSTSRGSWGCDRSRRPDASHAGCRSPLQKLRRVRGSESPRTRRPCCRRQARRRWILPWPPDKSFGGSPLRRTPGLYAAGAARRRRQRTSQGGHVPGSDSAPRARALLASQRAAPQLVPDPALLIGDEADAQPPLVGQERSARLGGESVGGAV